MGLASFAALLLVYAAPASAQATQSTEAENEADARHHFQIGSDLFEAGDYERAAEEFDAAYELSPRPELLYNIYLSHERLGNLARAEAALAAFVDAGTPGHRQAPLERRLERLRQRLEAQRAEEAAAAERERQLRDAAAERRDPGPWPWVVTGVGGAFAITGLALVLVAQADIDAVENPGTDPRWEDVSGRHDRAPLLSTLGIVGLGVGGLALLGGLAWGIATRDRGEDGLEVRVGPGRLELRGSF